MGFLARGDALSPRAVDVPVEGGHADVITMIRSLRVRRRDAPGIVGKGPPSVDGACQRDGRQRVVWIGAAIVKDDIRRPVGRINGQPGQDLVLAVVLWIVIDPNWRRPGTAAIVGS